MATSKPRQPRLRASCDGCFIAKVKCSKARPICSRCLACGIECRYSPSSRAGKPKSDTSSTHGSTGMSAADMAGLSPGSDDKGGMLYGPHQVVPTLYKIETGWHTPPTSVDGGMSRTHSISSGLAMLGVEPTAAGPADAVVAATADMYAGMPWTPPHDLSAQFADMSGIPGTQGHARSQSFDMTMAPWVDPSAAVAADMFAYSQSQLPTPAHSMASTYFPSPASTPNLRTAPRQKSTSIGSMSGSAGSCTCFTACLQSLQALHNASSPSAPPFDMVLSLNRKAVEGCASMLNCPRCMSRSGTHTAAMLLATVIGKITSFYKNASHAYFENYVQANGHPMVNGNGGMAASPTTASSSGLGISLGAYQVNGEDGRWLELEILARELRKLEEVYGRFREVCSDLSEDPEVSKAMISYLGQTLGDMMEVIHHGRRTDLAYS